MIRITQQNSAKDAKRYYATADYYSEGQEMVGSWGGKGHPGSVWKARWTNSPSSGCATTSIRQPEAVDGANPQRADGGLRFHVLRAEIGLAALRHERRPGHFGAFRAAVDETTQMEAEMKTRIRTVGQDTDRTTGNMVCGIHLHDVASR